MKDFVDQLPILDVHEHHMPDTFLNRDVGLLDLLKQSYAGWTQERPYPLPSENREEDPMLTDSKETTWEELNPFLEHSGSSHFVRNLVQGLDELYDLNGQGITEDNWQPLDAEIRKRHRDPDWPHEVMNRAGVTRIITDNYADPLVNAHTELGEHYQAAFRINALAMSWHPERRDHNGNSTFAIAKKLNHPCDTFEDYCHLLEHIVDTMSDRHHVALKNAIAYDRDIQFDEPDEQLARQAWGDPNPSPPAQKAFGDFAVDRLCQLAGERNLPVQMHLGTAIIRGSHPLNVAPLIERHPKTRFLLMHLAYPWSTDLLGMAFVYRNIWLDLTWSFLLSPSHFKRAFHEAIEVLPDESRMMLGGDNWHAEESFATFRTARRLIAEVLQEKINEGYFKRSDAERLARKIFSDNATAFFALPPA
ncbi:MAG: amidohydrolase family protein [Limisphaerales bacterium]